MCAYHQSSSFFDRSRDYGVHMFAPDLMVYCFQVVSVYANISCDGIRVLYPAAFYFWFGWWGSTEVETILFHPLL